MTTPLTVVVGYAGWQDIQLLTPVLTAAEIKIISVVSVATQMTDQARSYEADCILFSPSLQGMRPELVAALRVDEERPIAAVGLIPAGSSYAAEYQRYGMRGFVTTPLDTTQMQRLPTIIRDAVERTAEERKSRSFVPVTATDMLSAVDMGSWQQQTIAVFSPKGGVGKSTLAVNLAAALGVLAGRRTLLIDGDMSRANSHLFLGWQLADDPFVNLSSLYESVVSKGAPTQSYKVDAQTLRKHTRPYRNGLTVLPGIPNMLRAGAACFVADIERTENIFTELLNEARAPYEFRVVDLGPDYNRPIHWATLKYADTIFIVVTPERTALLDVKNLLPDLKQTFGTLERFRLVLNGFDEDFGISRKEVVKYLEAQLRIVGDLGWYPNDARLAINQGVPLVLQKPLSPLGRDLITLAAQLYPPLALKLKKLNQLPPVGFFKQVGRVFSSKKPQRSY